jgi:hypothetical protein
MVDWLRERDNPEDVLTILRVYRDIFTLVLRSRRHTPHVRKMRWRTTLFRVLETFPCPDCGENHLPHPCECGESAHVIALHERWGPEDGGLCPCGGSSCDGTCDSNHRLEFPDDDYEFPDDDYEFPDSSVFPIPLPVLGVEHHIYPSEDEIPF